MDTQVLIAGAGPTGLTLAVDLGMRGIRCTLIEQKEAPQFLPKMERVNARSMEIYRRMGLAEKIRDAGLPRNVPMDVFIVLSLAELPLLHLPYPSVAEAKKQIAATHDGNTQLHTRDDCSSASSICQPNTISVFAKTAFSQNRSGKSSYIRRPRSSKLRVCIG